MLIELEDKIIEVLRRNIKEIPEENIAVNREASSQPAITISNIGFKIMRGNISKDEEGEEVDEVFSGDGVKKIFNLKEKPVSIVSIELPAGRRMREIDDYIVNYDEGIVAFRNPPPKGRRNITIKYISARRRMMVVGLKLRARYVINILAQDRRKLDSIAELVVKSLIESEDEFEGIGAVFKPVKGEFTVNRVSLTYLAELELKLEKPIPPIEKIEISSK